MFSTVLANPCYRSINVQKCWIVAAMSGLYSCAGAQSEDINSPSWEAPQHVVFTDDASTARLARPSRRDPISVLVGDRDLHVPVTTFTDDEGVTVGTMVFVGSAERAEQAWWLSRDPTAEPVALDGLPVGLRVLAVTSNESTAFVLTETLSMRGRPAGLRSVLTIGIPPLADGSAAFTVAPPVWHRVLAPGPVESFRERSRTLPPLNVTNVSPTVCRDFLVQVRVPQTVLRVLGHAGLLALRRYGNLVTAPVLASPTSDPSLAVLAADIARRVSRLTNAERCCAGGCDGITVGNEAGRLTLDAVEFDVVETAH